MKDNFSTQADLYARYRPGYPPELFDFLVSQVKERRQAWDCATGNGQCARELSPYFEKVMATDITKNNWTWPRRRPILSTPSSRRSKRILRITVSTW